MPRLRKDTLAAAQFGEIEIDSDGPASRFGIGFIFFYSYP